MRESEYGSHDAAAEIMQWLDAEEELLHDFVIQLQAKSDKPLRILDLGCGYGRHLLSVTERHAVNAVGLDINERMIADALDRLHKRENANGHVSFVVGDAAFMGQLRPHSFDAAICMTNTIGNMPPEKQRTMLQRLSVVLRPGGSALLSVYGEASTNARVTSYEAIKLRVQKKGNRVLAAEGLSSECFSKQRLAHLVEDNGLTPAADVATVAGIGLSVSATSPEVARVNSP